MPAEDAKPSVSDKKELLERILASKTFKQTRALPKLLRFIVESHLDGKSYNIRQLGREVFGKWENWNTQDESVVREGLRRLRGYLREYYDTVGAEERLRIEIPAEKAVFSWNVQSPFEQQYRRALRYIRTNSTMALPLLESARSLKPDHAGAHAAWAEAQIWRLCFGNDLDVTEILSSAADAVRRALECDSSHWRAHVVVATLYCCYRRWEEAAIAFSSALKSSPQETNSHPWYPAFLMATAKKKEALDIVRAEAKENLADDWAQLTYVLFLYVAREFKKAQQVLSTMQILESNVWLADVLWSCLCLAGCEPKWHKVHFDLPGLPRLPNGEFAFPALSALLESAPPSEGEVFFRNLTKRMSKSFTRPPLDIPNAIIVVPRSEEWHEAEERKDDLKRRGDLRVKIRSWKKPEHERYYSYIGGDSLSPCQLALAHMALGETVRAIAALGKDFERHHPFSAWLHLWPVFDPLRDHDQFKELISRMDLPL